MSNQSSNLQSGGLCDVWYVKSVDAHRSIFPVLSGEGVETMVLLKDFRAMHDGMLADSSRLHHLALDRAAEIERLRAALERIAAKHDCGCRPCHCFDSAERMKIEYDGQREFAAEALGRTADETEASHGL